MSWRQRILQEFTPALAGVARLTVVSDPDELLLEQGVLDELRAAGFELVPFDDPVAFRFQYEQRFRQHWDRGDATNLVVALRTPQASVDDLPYDLLEEARGAGRVLRFNLAEVFPELVPAVVRSLDRQAFEPLWAALRDHTPSSTLGDNESREFVLRHVFEITPEHIKSPAHLLRVLLQRHHRGIIAPEPIDAYLIERLRRAKQWDDWPLESIIRSREAFFTFLQERWGRYLLRAAQPKGGPLMVSAPEVGYGLRVPGPLDLPFEHDDVRVYIDALFVEGMLHPVDPPSGLGEGWWSQGVTRPDPAPNEARRWEKLSETVTLGLPSEKADRNEWAAFAPRFAEWLSMRWSIELDGAAEQAAELAHDQVEVAFTSWMLQHFPALGNLPYMPQPTMVHQIPLYLRSLVKRGNVAKCALVVVDGLAYDQWIVLRDALQARRGSLAITERACFAWVPTLTSVSRQAIFAGWPPLNFQASINDTYKEKDHWQRLWSDAGLTGPAVAYIGHGKVGWATFLDEVRASAEHHRARALGIVVNTVDRTMHGMELGSRGMHAMVQTWARSGEFQDLLDVLHGAGFDVWLTADHGNIEATGIGKPDVGNAAESRGERIHVFKTSLLRDQVAKSMPSTIPWGGAGLPPDYYALAAPGRTAFVNAGTRKVGHGGISIEEVLVPFIHIGKRP